MIRYYATFVSKKISSAVAALPFLLAAMLVLGNAGESSAAAPAQPTAPPKVQATVKSVDTAGGLLTIKMENQTATLAVTPKTKISHADGRPLALADLQKNDEVKVAVSEGSGKPVASEVTVIMSAQFKEKGGGNRQGQGKGQGKNRG